MSSERGVRAGQTIKLRARFRDDLGDGAPASDVYVHIFEPESDLEDLTEATLVSGVPTYLGEGIYQYEYSTPGTGPDGLWNDVWEGILTGQPLSAELTFEVSASGVIETVPESQLYENNLVSITVASGIQAMDGTSLLEEFEMEFMTTTNPSYTNIRKVELSIGGLLGNSLLDTTIQTAILEASSEADVLDFRETKINSAVFRHARREYVTCLASQNILGNVISGALKAKTLDNLHVEYNTASLTDMMNRIQDCLDKWMPQLMAGGGAKSIAQPKGVVKGEYDPDRPVVSRMWQSTEDGTVSRRIPAANTRDRHPAQRRHLRTYKKKWW